MKVLRTCPLKLAASAAQAIVRSKKTEPWQPQLVGWHERRPSKTTLIWYSRTDQRRRRRCLAPKRSSCSVLGVVPSRCRLNSLSAATQSTSFLLPSIFRLHGCSFSGWNSPVGRFLISEASTFTIDNGDEATYDGTLTFSSKQAKEERF